MKTVKVSIWAEVDDEVTCKQIMESLPPTALKVLSPIFNDSMHTSLRVSEVDKDDFINSCSPESKECFKWNDNKLKELEDKIAA
jgi:hypothetical protein